MDDGPSYYTERVRHACISIASIYQSDSVFYPMRTLPFFPLNNYVYLTLARRSLSSTPFQIPNYSSLLGVERLCYNNLAAREVVFPCRIPFALSPFPTPSPPRRKKFVPLRFFYGTNTGKNVPSPRFLFARTGGFCIIYTETICFRKHIMLVLYTLILLHMFFALHAERICSSKMC